MFPSINPDFLPNGVHSSTVLMLVVGPGLGIQVGSTQVWGQGWVFRWGVHRCGARVGYSGGEYTGVGPGLGIQVGSTLVWGQGWVFTIQVCSTQVWGRVGYSGWIYRILIV